MYLLQFFSYSHLSEELQEISKPFCQLAFQIAEKFPYNGEAEETLRKLLEAKDCAVRAAIIQKK